MAMSLNAAKLKGPDENGRLYNTAYFDIKADTQSPVFDVISYSKRSGTFDWSKLYNQLSSFNADKIEYTIKTRVEIPSEFTTNEVYITIGNTFYFNLTSGGNWKESESLSETTKEASTDYYTVLLLTSSANDTKIASSNSILVKTKKDTFGNRYTDLEIKFIVDMVDGTDYIPSHRKHLAAVVSKNIGAKLEAIKIKVAPKSRTFQNKWVEPKIYVMDE